MFWLMWKKLSGSYFRLISTRRRASSARGGLEPAFRVLSSAVFHEFRSGISIGVANCGKVSERATSSPFALALHPPATSCDNQGLTKRVGVPCRSSARLERDTGASRACRKVCLKQRVNAYPAGEPVGWSVVGRP
jgi:hypothetical protein